MNGSNELPEGASAYSDDVLRNYIRCKNDRWFFLTHCCFTKDQTNKVKPIALIPKWDYLKLYVFIWEKYNKLAVPKSRRMTMSWVNIALYLHEVIFHKVRDVAFVSKKEDDAAELVRRAEFIFDHIPENILPRKLLPKKETRSKPPALIFPELDSRIQGFPMGADQLRQFTLSGILGDECAFWEDARKFYSSAAPTIEGGGRMTLISSRAPGLFQRIVYDQLDNDEQINEELTPEKNHPFGNDSVITWVNPKNKFFIFDVHYTANPLKQAPEYKEAVKSSMPIKEFLVEYERNWDAFSGKAVFEDYDKRRHELRSRELPHLGLPLLCGWDFGLTPACIVAQLRGTRLHILREFVATNASIRQFTPQVMNALLQHYPSWNDQKKDFIHYIDPAGMHKNQVDSRTCMQEMASQGLKNISPGPIDWETRRKSVEHFLTQHTKEGPGLTLYAPDCPTLSRGFSGGYRYPEKYLEVEPGNPRPIKDQYSHPHDALQYLAGGAVALLSKQGTLTKHIPVPGYAFAPQKQVGGAYGSKRR